MSVRLTHLDEWERSGNWQLVRRTLGVNAFGLNLVDIPPGEQIPEHDETERDQEEVFYVVSGSPTLMVDGENTRRALGRSRVLPPSTVAPCAARAMSSPGCSSPRHPGQADTDPWSGHDNDRRHRPAPRDHRRLQRRVERPRPGAHPLVAR